MSDSQYRQEFECDFTAAVANQLIALDLLIAARGKHLRADEFGGAPVVLGVDVARYGDDRSVIQRRQGLAAFVPRVFRGIDNMTLAGLVAQEIVAEKPDAVFIDAGRGEGVIDRLRQLGHAVVEVNFGGKALNPARYANRRAEMWDATAQWLRDGGALPDDLAMQQDAGGPQYSFDASGRMALEPKEETKKRLGMSPDLWDALALTFAEPVVKRETMRVRGAPARAVTDYDVLA